MNRQAWSMERGSSSSSPLAADSNNHHPAGFAVGADGPFDNDDDAIAVGAVTTGTDAATSTAAGGAEGDPSSTNTAAAVLKHKRRFCKFPGCQSIVKSQGLCQRHGAKPRQCKVSGCGKQAQGNFNGMCKKHYRDFKQPQPQQQEQQLELGNDDDDDAIDAVAAAAAALLSANGSSNNSNDPPSPRESSSPPPPPLPIGESVYDNIIPASIAWSMNSNHHQQHHHSTPAASATSTTSTTTSSLTSSVMMPLVAHLKAGFENASKTIAWHRNEERAARGMWPVSNIAAPLEHWERSLVFTEYLLLLGSNSTGGGTSGSAAAWSRDVAFRYLARAWGRDKGFHLILAQSICEKRGDVERKQKQLQHQQHQQQFDPTGNSNNHDFTRAATGALESMNHHCEATNHHHSHQPRDTNSRTTTGYNQHQDHEVWDNNLMDSGASAIVNHDNNEYKGQRVDEEELSAKADLLELEGQHQQQQQPRSGAAASASGVKPILALSSSSFESLPARYRPAATTTIHLHEATDYIAAAATAILIDANHPLPRSRQQLYAGPHPFPPPPLQISPSRHLQQQQSPTELAHQQQRRQQDNRYGPSVQLNRDNHYGGNDY